MERRNTPGETAPVAPPGKGPPPPPAMLRTLRRWPLLPLALLVTMVVIGLALEQGVYGAGRWLSKLPLIGLFAALALRRWSAVRKAR